MNNNRKSTPIGRIFYMQIDYDFSRILFEYNMHEKKNSVMISENPIYSRPYRKCRHNPHDKKDILLANICVCNALYTTIKKKSEHIW